MINIAKKMFLVQKPCKTMHGKVKTMLKKVETILDSVKPCIVCDFMHENVNMHNNK